MSYPLSHQLPASGLASCLLRSASARVIACGAQGQGSAAPSFTAFRPDHFTAGKILQAGGEMEKQEQPCVSHAVCPALSGP